MKRVNKRLRVWRYFRDPDFCVFIVSLTLSPLVVFPIM